MRAFRFSSSFDILLIWSRFSIFKLGFDVDCVFDEAGRGKLPIWPNAVGLKAGRDSFSERRRFRAEPGRDWLADGAWLVCSEASRGEVAGPGSPAWKLFSCTFWEIIVLRVLPRAVGLSCRGVVCGWVLVRSGEGPSDGSASSAA